MTQHTTEPTSTIVDAVGSPPDVRRIWRIALAIVAPVPWLALAISNGITPDDLGGTTEETFRAIAADPDTARAAQWLGAAFALLVVPSAVAMIVAHRRVMPRLTLIVGGILVFVGAKMTVSHWYHLNTYVSLAVIVAMLGAAIFLSLQRTRQLALGGPDPSHPHHH